MLVPVAFVIFGSSYRRAGPLGEGRAVAVVAMGAAAAACSCRGGVGAEATVGIACSRVVTRRTMM